ncbi:MAG: dipeptide/oligopeptide/nickel ABC transporter ATP-binding protein [Myxococcota bacterium]
MSAAWSVRGLVKAYGGVRALDGVDFEVQPGERVALIGASGSGKTSLVRCGLGLVPPDAGAVSVLGRDAAGLRPRDWRALRHQVQILFQDSRAMLHPDLPVGVLIEESVALHRPGADPRAVAQDLLAQVDLGHRAHALPRELSGGERRRAGIARVLAARPALLVADEPLAGLDAVLKPRILARLMALVGPECAVVVVTHDLGAVAPQCDRVVVMDGGRVVDAVAVADLGPGYRPSAPCTIALLAAAGIAAEPPPGAKGMSDGTAEGGG